MTLNFGTSGSRIECSFYGYHSYIWINEPVGEATGLGFCSGKYPVQYEGYQWEQLMGDLKIDLKFASKALLSQIQYWGCQGGCMTAISLLSGPIRLMYLCYCLNLQINMGNNMGM